MPSNNYGNKEEVKRLKKVKQLWFEYCKLYVTGYDNQKDKSKELENKENQH